MSRQQTLFSPSSITAVMTIITATIALSVGVWENAQMQEHNRLSVTPHLQLIAEFRAAEADTVDQGIVRVSNEGIGPAVIDRIDVLVTGPDGEVHRFGTWGEARGVLKDLYGVVLSMRAELPPGVMIGVDRTYDLAVLEKLSVAAEPLFPSLLEHLELRIAYHSVYGESFETDLEPQRSLVEGERAERESPGSQLGNAS